MQFAGRRAFFALVLLVALTVGPADAQLKKPAAPTVTPATMGNPAMTAPANTRGGPFDGSRQIFISGRVMFEDGSPINHDVAIERVCNGSSRIEGHADSKGRFSIALGQPNTTFQDASTYGDTGSGSPSTNAPLGGASGSSIGSGGPGSSVGTSTAALAGCDLRASYPGYRSDSVVLAEHRALDNPDIGTIVLHRLGSVLGTTISLTTAMAPKDAAKAYAKGMEALSKENEDLAERQFRKAVDIYPQYAIAWFELGRIEQRSRRIEAARHSFEQARQADPKYVSPVARLAGLDVEQQKWPEAVETSSKGLALNPVEFPDLWYYNAVSLYRTGKPDDAVKSARECLKLDTQHKHPSALLVLASVSAERSDWAGAVRNFHDYLQLAPDAENAGAVRKQLADVEQNLASAKK